MPHKIKINYCSRFEECEGCHIRFLRLQVGVFFTSGLAKMRVGTSYIVIIMYPNIIIPQYFTRFVALLP